jgi:hypothetical protein
MMMSQSPKILRRNNNNNNKTTTTAYTPEHSPRHNNKSNSGSNKKGSRFRMSVVIPLFLIVTLSLNLSIVYLHLGKNKNNNNKTGDDSSSSSNPTKDETQGITNSINKVQSTKLLQKSAIVLGKENALNSSENQSLLLRAEKGNGHDNNKNNNHNQAALLSATNTTATGQKPVVIAHVVSLIKCTKQASVTGFLDAAAVLRHSIHQQSIHAASSSSSSPPPSKYSYKMYAIVHEDCQDHAKLLDRLGYTSMIQPSPVLLTDIEPGWYRDHVEAENCCGSKEFIKLYAYTLLDHPIVIHWDMDVAILKPLEDVYDSMLYPADSPQGMQARRRLQVQHPERPLPDPIDAFFTRDITSAQPWEIRQGVQGGFLVARPSMEHFQAYLQFIKRGNYTKGRGNFNGWDNLGYGGFQGAMAYQGVVAYFYDQLAPNTAVELNGCLYNQVVADVIWRGPKALEHMGQCREYPRPGDTFDVNTPENGKCQDCRSTPVEDVITVHYTACKKPWECSLPTPRETKKKEQVYRLSQLTNVTTCGLLFKKWFDFRHDFEKALEQVGHVKPSQRNGKYYPESFGGYCAGPGSYISMKPPPPEFDSSKIYGM